MNSNPSTSPARDWLVTGLVCLFLMGGAWVWRSQQGEPLPTDPLPKAASKPTAPADMSPLARTRRLVRQKLDSLEAYNDAIDRTVYLREFSSWAENHAVESGAFDTLSRLMMDRMVPELWRAAQRETGGRGRVTHAAMSKVIHRNWPQQLLPNGHVVLFPNHPRLRLVASERRQDYLRDTGWHWRWIGKAIEQGAAGELSEVADLDIYAAEELSEFLSVLAVGILEWSAHLHDPPLPKGTAINATVMNRTLALMHAQAAEYVSQPRRSEALYSQLTREQVLAGLPQPMFREATQRLGIEFVHATDPGLDASRAKLVLPTGLAGGGVRAAGYDGDGFTDLYFAGSNGGALCRNVNGRRFETVTEAAGIVVEGETRAGYFADYDNDGDLDLFLSVVLAPNRLFRNEGLGRFTDVTQATGVGGGELVTHGAVWFDYDRDGLLDLYVANFGMWPQGASPELGIRNRSAPPNQLFHHRVVAGEHVFEEVGETMGVADRGWSHCVGAWDFDQDGWPDLISLNDFGQSIAYRNGGGKKFVEETRTLHLDVLYNAMNFQLLDLEHTGHPALYVTEISKLTHRVRYPKPVQGTQVKFAHLDNLRALVLNKLFRRLPSGVFEDVHDIHIEPAKLGWAWDASVFDFENDGDLDLLVLNGTEGNSPNATGPKGSEFLIRHAWQRNACFLSEKNYFYDVSPRCALAYEGNSRGSAWFDFDKDGDLDVAISDYKGPARVFENQQDAGHQWIRFQLEGARGNRNAIGARVEVRFSGQTRFDSVVSAKGFLSQNPMALHYGLGSALRVDKVLVTWPTGKVSEHGPFAAGRLYRIQESSGK